MYIAIVVVELFNITELLKYLQILTTATTACYYDSQSITL